MPPRNTSTDLRLPGTVCAVALGFVLWAPPIAALAVAALTAAFWCAWLER